MTVIFRVTAIYRAVIYRFDCIQPRRKYTTPSPPAHFLEGEVRLCVNNVFEVRVKCEEVKILFRGAKSLSSLDSLATVHILVVPRTLMLTV